MADISISEWLAEIMSSHIARAEIVGDSPDAARGARVIAGRLLPMVRRQEQTLGFLRAFVEQLEVAIRTASADGAAVVLLDAESVVEVLRGDLELHPRAGLTTELGKARADRHVAAMRSGAGFAIRTCGYDRSGDVVGGGAMLEEIGAELAEPARMDGEAGTLNDSDDRGVSCQPPMFSHGGGI